MHFVDLAVLVLYFAGMLAIGFAFARKSGRTDEYMAAGRSLPGWAVGLSLFGAYVSSISFIALPGKAYKENWNGFVFSLSLPITAYISTRWFVPFYRRLGQVSAYEHLEKRFGPWARQYAMACYMLTHLVRVGMIAYLVALAVAPLTGWPVETVILLVGVSVTVYSMVGGLEAVIWTDVVQSGVLILGVLVCVGLLLFGLPDGPWQLFAVAADNDKFSLGSFAPDLTTSTFWVVLLYGVFINLNNFGIDQSFVQRYQTARTDGDARRSVWLGALLYVPISALFFFIGTALFAYYQARPGELPGDVAKKPDTVFPYFMGQKVPVGILGLLIAALLAAAMSSISTCLNAAATLFLCDVYKRYLRPSAGERECMRVLHAGTLVAGVGCILTALALMEVRTALDAWWELAGIFSGGMLGLFLLGLIAHRATNAAAAAGTIAGMLVLGWLILPRLLLANEFLPAELDFLVNPFHGFMTIVVGTLVILLVGLLVTALRGQPRPRNTLTPEPVTHETR
jgi:SSS family solute:Na+ symporter